MVYDRDSQAVLRQYALLPVLFLVGEVSESFLLNRRDLRLNQHGGAVTWGINLYTCFPTGFTAVCGWPAISHMLGKLD